MTARLALPAKLDQKAALALTDDLRAHRGADLEVDAGAVTHVGAVALQALLSAAATWRADGHALRLSNASDRCVEQLGLLGFTPERLIEGADA